MYQPVAKNLSAKRRCTGWATIFGSSCKARGIGGRVRARKACLADQTPKAAVGHWWPGGGWRRRAHRTTQRRALRVHACTSIAPRLLPRTPAPCSWEGHAARSCLGRCPEGPGAGGRQALATARTVSPPTIPACRRATRARKGAGWQRSLAEAAVACMQPCAAAARPHACSLTSTIQKRLGMGDPPGRLLGTVR